MDAKAIIKFIYDERDFLNIENERWKLKITRFYDKQFWKVKGNEEL